MKTRLTLPCFPFPSPATATVTLVLTVTVILALLYPSSLLAAENRFQHPPIPKESPETEKIAIVTTSKSLTKHEIEEIIQPFSDVKLRYIYKHALNGFSIKGSIASLEKLGKTNKVSLVSPVNTYKAESEKNIRIIGGDVVRGYFDEAHNRLTGKGVTVGVIDTGMDYTHPDLKDSYEGGHDLVDGDEDPMETKNFNGPATLHGTHVTGIIAANGRIQGVAPEANVLAYRALGPGGAGTTEQVLAAIDEAIKDKVDILNLSLGNEINGPDLPISLAINKAVEKGIVAVTSSGNSGPNMWTVGSPGTAAKGISVGASTPPLSIPYLTINKGTEKIRLEPMDGGTIWNLDRSYKIAYGGLGKKGQLKKVKGKIALVERGEITFTEKARNALEAGAVAIIIYNNTKGEFLGNLEERVNIPVSSVSKEAGERLRDHSQNKKAHIRTNIIEEKDLLADFSSRGPVTSTWEIKPDVVAPGVAINSTVPGGYLALQGTSMAAPHVAGACALIKQAHPDWSPEKIKAALMNTAKPITNEKGEPYRTYEQGAGRIQIEDAINTQSIVMPGSLQYGRFQLTESTHKHKQFLTIVNEGNKIRKYSFSIPKNETGFDWEIPFSFTLKPKESRKLEVKMIVDPQKLTKKMYDGHLLLQAGSQKIRIPYLYVIEEPNYPRVMGFGFGLGDQKEVYRYEVYLPGGAEEFGIALFDPDSYQFVGFLDSKRQVGKGLLTKEIAKSDLPKEGIYFAKVFARKAGQEDIVDATIYIQK